VSVVLAASWLVPASAAAYSPSGARSWADNHAQPSTENCQLSVCTPNDCAAFVSQVLWWGGGYHQTVPNTTNTHDHHFWWEKTVQGAFAYTESWTLARALYDFQIFHNPGGQLLEVRPGTETTVESGTSTGSLLFYDWTGNGSIDHVAIQVGRGTDPTSGYYGDYVDQHSTGYIGGPHFYHGFWSDYPYNPNATSTKIYVVQISNSN
jgi:hypothetical protein